MSSGSNPHHQFGKKHIAGPGFIWMNDCIFFRWMNAEALARSILSVLEADEWMEIEVSRMNGLLIEFHPKVSRSSS